MAFFHNPAFGRAAESIAAMFAPPSGAEAAGWAAARAKQAEAEAKQAEARRLQEYSDYMKGPEYDEAMGDRMGLGAGQYNPSQSFRAVDTDAATKRYGFDTQAATGRYGHDRTFDASRLNNADDNVRALTDREMQEAAAMERLGVTDATQRYGFDRTFDASVQNNQLTNQRSAITDLFKPLDPGQTRPAVPAELMEALQLPEVAAVAGGPKPLSETEWKAGQNQRLLDSGQLTDDALLDAIMGDKTPVQAVGPTGQPRFMSPGAAVRSGAQPYEAASSEKIDNYLAVGPNGEEVRFPGYVGPNGQIVNANNKQVVPNIIRKEGTGGGINFEADGQGGMRFTTGGAGNTVSQQTNLQGQRDAATQSAQELQTLFNNISASDVGVAGNFNDALTNYGAQIWPNVARGDVTAMRSQMQATTMRLARSLAGDNKISETDRRMAQEVMAGQGLGESLPGAKAKIAALTVLHAYRAKFAGSLASGGDALPPINGSVLGQLVDDGTISPAIADEYQQTMLSRSRGGPTQIPGVTGTPAPQQPAPAQSSAPASVDPADWEFMTPEQKALFQ